MLNDPPHALLNSSTATAALPPWNEVSIWTSKACDEVSYNRLPVRLSLRLFAKSRCNLVGICPTVNARSGWKLVTFESYFRIFVLSLVIPYTSHSLLAVLNAST